MKALNIITNTGTINIDPNIDNGSMITMSTLKPVKCSRCKKEIEVSAISYGATKNNTRHICKWCYTECTDKVFGLKLDLETERALYEESD